MQTTEQQRVSAPAATYQCCSERCGWTGIEPSWSDLSSHSRPDDQPPSAPTPRHAALCPQCLKPARRVHAPLLALPILSRVPATPELIGGLDLALGLLDSEFAAGRLAPGVGPQINELRSLHVQLLANRKSAGVERAA